MMQWGEEPQKGWYKSHISAATKMDRDIWDDDEGVGCYDTHDGNTMVAVNHSNM